MTDVPLSPPTLTDSLMPLPGDGAATWQSLPARAATLIGWTSAVSTLIPFLIFGVVCVFANPTSPTVYWAVSAAGMVLVPLTGWLAARRIRHTQWRLDDNALAVRRQRLWFSDTRIPRARVQHLDIQRGPFERRAGLSTLVVHTAGSHLHALRVSGLDQTDAEQLRELLARPQDHDGL